MQITSSVIRGWFPSLGIALSLTAAVSASAQTITPLPRIGARSASPAAQFYNTATGAVFTPAGSNYIKLDRANGSAYHITFNTGFYDGSAAETALSYMQSYGYNVVRVFIDPGDSYHQGAGKFGAAGPASTDSATLYAPFMANVIDFLERANRHNVYVIPVLDYVPYNSYYEKLVDTGRPTNITGTNSFYLFDGAVTSKVNYVKEFAQEIGAADSGALSSTIFAYEIANEAGCNTYDAPFSSYSGTVSTQDGVTYNMAIPSDRQQCQDSNTGIWAQRCIAGIHSVDPSAMVTCSVFTFAAVGKPGPNGLMPISGADGRYPARPMWLDKTSLSYIDIHEYPLGSSWSVTNDLKSSEIGSIDVTAKPILQGENGADKNIYPDTTSAAYAIRDQNAAIKSIGFAGSLLWTWDDDSSNYWTMLDNNGALNGVLSPNR